MPLKIYSDRLGCNAKPSAGRLINMAEMSSLEDLESDCGGWDEWLQSIDTVFPFVSSIDVYVRSVVSHCSNDLICKGVLPKYATISVGLGVDLSESEKHYLSRELLNECDRLNIKILNMHTYEPTETAITICVTGKVVNNLKSLGNEEMAIILTKPIGLSVAAASEPVWKAINDGVGDNHFSIINYISRHAFICSTDISGYGLLGHLSIASKAYSLSINLQLERLIFDSAYMQCLGNDGPSCSAQENINFFSEYVDFETDAVGEIVYGAFQGETNGPLAIFVEKSKSEEILQDIKRAELRPQIIGVAKVSSEPSVRVGFQV